MLQFASYIYFSFNHLCLAYIDENTCLNFSGYSSYSFYFPLSCSCFNLIIKQHIVKKIFVGAKKYGIQRKILLSYDKNIMTRKKFCNILLTLKSVLTIRDFKLCIGTDESYFFFQKRFQYS